MFIGNPWTFQNQASSATIYGLKARNLPAGNDSIHQRFLNPEKHSLTTLPWGRSTTTTATTYPVAQTLKTDC